MTEHIQQVYFHGTLGKKWGIKPIEIAANSIKDIFSGLVANLGHEFKQDIRIGSWCISTGPRSSKSKVPQKSDNLRSEKEIDLMLGSTEVHVFPAITGAGGGKQGWMQMILGVVLIVVGIIFWATPFGVPLVVAGVGMVLGGAMAMMSKPPNLGNYSSTSAAAQKPSFIFNGVVNTMEQGGPVPLVYGLHLTGSVVISASTNVLQI